MSRCNGRHDACMSLRLPSCRPLVTRTSVVSRSAVSCVSHLRHCCPSYCIHTVPRASPYRYDKHQQCRSRIRSVKDGSEEHSSALLSHSCCGGGSTSHSETNPIHRALSQSLSSIRLLNWIGSLHHGKLGSGIALAGLLLYLSPFHFVKKWTQTIGTAVVVCFSGLPLFRSALLQICRLEVDAAVLMSISALGSICSGMAGEGLLLLLLFQISHLLESKFTNRSKTSLRELLNSVPDKTEVVEVNPLTKEPIMDSATTLRASEVPVGSYILVKPGDKVPLDGVVEFGSASVTVEHISGESLPIPVHKGSRVAAGSHNADGLLVLNTLATVEDSTPAKIARLAVEAQSRKPPVHRWIDQVTTLWSKCALLVACGVALVCGALGVPFYGVRGALYRSLCIVTAAAPCSLVLTPLAYVCALANASQRLESAHLRHLLKWQSGCRSILIKSAAVLDTLHSCSYVALDKTGTLTEGKLVCTDIVNAEDITQGNGSSLAGTPRKHRALCHAVDLSKRSTHPIANAIVDAGRQYLLPEDGNCGVSDFELVPGYGVRGTIRSRAEGNRPLLATLGSFEFIQEQLHEEKTDSELEKAVSDVRHRYGSSISVLTTHESDGRNLEWSAFCFRDELQTVSKIAVRALQEGTWKTGKPRDVFRKQISIVTGDHEKSGQLVGEMLNVKHIVSEHSPEDKLDFVLSTQASLKKSGTKRPGLVMVGDGINDAPALAQADVGVSISETATDLSATAADIILLNGQGVANLPFLFLLSDRVRSIIIQNLVLTFSAMLIVCVPSLKGYMPLWLTVLFHEGSTLLTAMNSCRLLFVKPRKAPK